MLQAALAVRHRRTAARSSSCSAARLPEGRRYGVVAGVGRALDAIEAFRFDDADARGARRTWSTRPTLDWLAAYRFSGDMWGYAEGEAYFAHSPLLVVEASFAEAVVLETVLLSIYNHDSAIASAASRMTLGRRRPAVHRDGLAAHPRGGRGRGRAGGVRRRLRGHLATSRPGSATASRRPAPARTASRCCTTPRRTRSAPRSSSLGVGTTLLVDTYDVAEAVRIGVEVAGPELGAVRLDSGDLGVLAAQVRAQLDSLGAHRHPDHRHQRPRRARDRRARGRARRRLRRRHPAGHRQRPPDLRLRLQAGRPRGRRPGVLESVAKKSVDKVSVGGRKYALRRRDADGVAEAEVVGIGAPARRRRRRPRAARAAGPRRRGRRPGAARGRPRPARRGPGRAAGRGRSRCRAASRSSRRVHE